MEIGSAYISLLPSMQGFGSKMQAGIGPQIDSTAKTTGSRFGKLFATTTMGPLRALGGAALGFAAFSALKNGISGAIGEAREAEVVGARTANVIKSMGLSSEVTAGQVGKLAMAISNKSAVDDEAVQNGQNLLLTFGSVAKSAGESNGVFAKTSQLMVDMSAAMGTDMKSSAIQLGKALNDPIKGVSALTRVGVSFTAQQKEQIAGFIESGQMAKAQGVILGEVSKQFGGAAAAMASPADRLKVSWANFQEQIGTMLLPVVDKLMATITTSVLPGISSFVTGVQSGTGAGGAFASIVTKLWSVFTTFGGALVSVLKFLNQHRTAVTVLAGAIGALMAVTKAHAAVLAVTAAGGLLKYLQATKLVTAATKVWTAVQAAFNLVLLANPIGLVIVGVAALAAGLVIAYKKSETFRGIVDKLWAAIKVAAGWVSDIAQKLTGLLADALGSVIDKGRSLAGIWDVVKSAGTSAFNAIRDAVQWVIDKVQALINAIQSIPGIPGGGSVKGDGSWVGGPPAKGVSAQSLTVPSLGDVSARSLSSDSSVLAELRAIRKAVGMQGREFGREINTAAAAAQRSAS